MFPTTSSSTSQNLRLGRPAIDYSALNSVRLLALVAPILAVASLKVSIGLTIRNLNRIEWEQEVIEGVYRIILGVDVVEG